MAARRKPGRKPDYRKIAALEAEVLAPDNPPAQTSVKLCDFKSHTWVPHETTTARWEVCTTCGLQARWNN